MAAAGVEGEAGAEPGDLRNLPVGPSAELLEWTVEMRPMGTIAVGTSGWSYRHWAGRFYPEGLRSGEWLRFYAGRFPTVEVNATFYRLPADTMVAHWAEVAPPGFEFVTKGSRLVTHLRRLVEVDEAVARFMERVGGLGGALGAVLWQLPPDLERDAARLDAFLSGLPPVRSAVEFRHPSWLCEEVYDVLSRHGAALVAVSSTIMPAVRRATAGFVYARFHGLAGGYGHSYTDDELAPWAEWLAAEAAAGRDGYAFFNNDAEAAAPRDAARLMELLGDVARPPVS